MNIAHECPLELLKKSREFNDYDYALVHLFETQPIYYNFFVESLKRGRKVLLDNSIFELGTAYNEEEFVKWIEKLKPTEYIIPDVLEDTDKTIANVINWTNKYNTLPGIKIGVIQGRTKEETIKCYQEIEPLVDKIAISFDYSFHIKTSVLNKPTQYLLGRINLLDEIIERGAINFDKPHHLLGCSLPQEFKHYALNKDKYSFIESIDTSNPIVHGMLGIQYSEEGLTNKRSIKLVDLLEAELTEQQRIIIDINVKQFKSFINGK